MKAAGTQTAKPWGLLVAALLRMYPAWFRREYAPQIQEAARVDLRRPANGTVPPAWRVVSDVAVNLGRAWMSTVRSGGVERAPGRSASRLAPGSGGFRGLGHDVRAAARGMARRPGFALLAVATLAIGIGLTAAMFSIVQGLALRGLPLEDPEQVVAVRRIDPRLGQGAVLFSDIHLLRDLESQQTTLQGLAGWQGAFMNLADEHEPAAAIPGLRVSEGFFDLLRVEPVLGRDFTREDGKPGADSVAIISDELWRNRFAASADVLGADVRLDGVPTRVVGILDRGFAFPWNTDVWVPLQIDATAIERGAGPPLALVGRLREGVSERQAQAELTMIAERLGEQYPDTDSGYRVWVREWTADFLGASGMQALMTMLFAVSMVLVLACVNVANLLLVRAIANSRELALRAALGAARLRLVRQSVVDALIIAVLGAGGGIVIAHLGSRWFALTMQELVATMPFYVDVRLDGGVLIFVSLLAVASGLASALLPVLQIARGNSHDLLRDGARSGASPRVGRVSRLLVVVQVTVACALLISAGSFAVTVGDLRSLDLGLDPDELFTAAVTLPDSTYSTSERRRGFHAALLESLQGRAGVESAALATDLPLAGLGSTRFGMAGTAYAAREAPRARLAAVSPGYFEVVGLSPLRGRLLAADDSPESISVAVVTRSFAARYLRGDPVGARIVLSPPADAVPGTAQEIQIVGVVAELYERVPAPGLPREAILVPLSQRSQAGIGGINVLARTGGDPLAIASLVRSELVALDPDLPLGTPTTVRQALLTNHYHLEIFGALFGAFGIAALVLSGVGVYGVMAFTTAQRRHEVGVRLALGATSRGVAGLVLRQGLVRVAIGMVLGMALGQLLATALATFLGVTAGSPGVLVAVATALVLTSLLGCWLPASRAARVDPAVTLSSE